jgi:hypothetical protein
MKTYSQEDMEKCDLIKSQVEKECQKLAQKVALWRILHIRVKE